MNFTHPAWPSGFFSSRQVCSVPKVDDPHNAGRVIDGEMNEVSLLENVPMHLVPESLAGVLINRIARYVSNVQNCSAESIFPRQRVLNRVFGYVKHLGRDFILNVLWDVDVESLHSVAACCCSAFIARSLARKSPKNVSAST